MQSRRSSNAKSQFEPFRGNEKPENLRPFFCTEQDFWGEWEGNIGRNFTAAKPFQHYPSLPRVINIKFPCSLTRNITSQCTVWRTWLCIANSDEGWLYDCQFSLPHFTLLFNPFTPKSDQFKICPAASPEIKHHTVWRTWLCIANSDERWLYDCQFSLPHFTLLFNPFTPKSDQFKICPAASPEILHHTVWITWLFIANSDQILSYYQFSLPHLYIPVQKVGRM